MYFMLRWKLLETMCVSPHFFFAPALFEEKKLLCQSWVTTMCQAPCQTVMDTWKVNFHCLKPLRFGGCLLLHRDLV